MSLIKFLLLRQEIPLFSLPLAESFEEYKMINSASLFYYYTLIIKPSQFQQKIQNYSSLEFSGLPFGICRLSQAVLLTACNKHNRRDNAAETI